MTNGEKSERRVKENKNANKTITEVGRWVDEGEAKTISPTR